MDTVTAPLGANYFDHTTQLAWMVQLQMALGALPPSPIERWLAEPGLQAGQSFSAWLALSDSSIVVQDHQASSLVAIPLNALAQNTMQQIVEQITQAREAAFAGGYLNHTVTGPTILKNIERFLNNPQNGCMLNGRLAKQWIAKDFPGDPSAICLVNLEGGTPDQKNPISSIKLARLRLLSPSLDVIEYVLSHAERIHRTRLRCASGAPYDGDDHVRDATSSIGQKSPERWSINQVSESFYRVWDSLRLVSLLLPVTVLDGEKFNVAILVGHELSRRYRGEVGFGDLVLPKIN